jgi:hypothetical protein
MNGQPKKKLISLPSDYDDDDFGDESIATAIERVLGPEALEKVRNAVGGARVSFPPAGRLQPDHWLAATVGFEDAYRFCDEVFSADYGARHVYIPLGPNAAQEKTRQRISELLDDGLSANEISRLLKCHVRTVWRTKRRFYETNASPHPKRSRQASSAAARKSAVRGGDKAHAIVRQLLMEGHSAALLRDLLAVPGSAILSIKSELIREGKL